MLKQPLFGQDSSPHQTSMFLSGIITLIGWIIFCVLSLVIKIKPQTPQYQEVQIVLASTPVEEKSQEAEEAAAPSESAVLEEQTAVTEESTPVVEETPAVVEQKPAVVEPVETTPKPTPAPAKSQTQPAKTTTTPATKTTDPSKKVNFDDYQYATDYSDFDFNNTSTSKKATWDDSMFNDSSSDPEPQVSQQVKTVTTQSSTSGSAASTSTSKTQSQSSAQNKPSTTTQSASSATSNALSNIRNTQYSTSSGTNTKSITDAKTTKGSDGTLSMAMIDGTTRVLIKPVPPVIQLSEASAALIDSTRTVTIEFQVLSSGNVPRTQIKITPESLLPTAVRTEIYDQLSNWLFESSSSAAIATFEYTIKKN